MAEKLNNMVSIDILAEDAEEIVKDFCDDHSGEEGSYLCDAIMQWADESVSIYYSEIGDYLVNHMEEVNDIINEFGWDGVGCNIRKATQLAQCVAAENDLLSQIEEVWKYMAYNYLYRQEDDEAPEELVEAIEEWASDFGSDVRIREMSDSIEQWFLDHKEEQEEEEDE